MQDWSITTISEDSLLVEWAVDIKEGDETNKLIAKIAMLSQYLLAEHQAVVINVTPAYRTCLIQFDLFKTDESAVVNIVETALNKPHQVENIRARLHQLPVYYDPSVAADLSRVCDDNKITLVQLIKLHTSSVYDVHAVGFLPGFAYLGYLPEQLESARHKSYRANVPTGSVGIADRQTAIYPCASPGGWQIIGRCPTALLDKQHSVLKAGDKVQFIAINHSEYLSLGGQI